MRAKPPYDDQALERTALFYAGRYATTRARLAAYLQRKLRERGWAGAGAAPVDALVARMAELGYVDDGAFASARAESLSRRGYGVRRIVTALRAAGIGEEDSAPARERAAAAGWEAALRYAERRRIGPFAAAPPDRDRIEKALAAMLRAGHRFDMAQRIVRAPPGKIPPADDG